MKNIIKYNKEKRIYAILDGSIGILCVVSVALLSIYAFGSFIIVGLSEAGYMGQIDVSTYISDKNFLLLSTACGTFSFLLGFTAIFLSKFFAKLFTNQQFDLQKSIEQIEDITTIQEKMHEIGKTIKKILILRKVLFWINTKKTFNEIDNYFKGEIGVFLSSMINLRSDLLTRIEEQKQTLTGAKADVEEHITGTTALEQVSEAQKLRLDEQIRQFENLQRVLVKV